jgi:hypothetical protein
MDAPLFHPKIWEERALHLSKPEAQPSKTGLLLRAWRNRMGNGPTVRTANAKVIREVCSSTLLMELSQRERFNLF